MNDRRSEHTRSAQQGTEQTQRIHQPYPRYTDPAYSGQSSYPPPYYSGPSFNSNANHPTEKLPQYWIHGQPPPDRPTAAPEPRRPKAPRWLWIAATAAVLLVAALVIALVIANGSGSQTAAPTLPAMPSTAHPAPTTSTSPSPSASTTTSEPTSTESNPPATAGAMQSVVYSVTGEGRAISITYVDNDGMMQTEFNVALPWSKEVSVRASGGPTAAVTIVNIGHDVTCTVTVDGVEVNERNGVGLTMCNATG